MWGLLTCVPYLAEGSQAEAASRQGASHVECHSSTIHTELLSPLSANELPSSDRPLRPCQASSCGIDIFVVGLSPIRLQRTRQKLAICDNELA